MTAIDPQTTLASLVLDHPSLAEVLERLELDFCCRGDRSLAAACAERGLDAETVALVLEAQAGATQLDAGHDYDAASAATAELCDHIVSAHHAPLRLELPRLGETAATVVRVHGADDPRLSVLAQVLQQLSDELHSHLDREEQLLFPACVAAAADTGAVDERVPLGELEHDHDGAGEALRELRELTDGYALGTARCGTHRALLAGLAALERDLHVHIHEENNVLFPRIRSRLALEGQR